MIDRSNFFHTHIFVLNTSYHFVSEHKILIIIQLNITIEYVYGAGNSTVKQSNFDISNIMCDFYANAQNVTRSDLRHSPPPQISQLR